MRRIYRVQHISHISFKHPLFALISSKKKNNHTHSNLASLTRIQTPKSLATTRTVPPVVVRAIRDWFAPVYLVAPSPPCLMGALPSPLPRYYSDVAVWVAPAVWIVSGQLLTVDPIQIYSFTVNISRVVCHTVKKSLCQLSVNAEIDIHH